MRCFYDLQKKCRAFFKMSKNFTVMCLKILHMAKFLECITVFQGLIMIDSAAGLFEELESDCFVTFWH